jgi:hypothetical protein
MNIVFIGFRDKRTYNNSIPGVTLGKTYTIVGFDLDGDAYFIDDDGENNFSASQNGDGIFYVTE